MFKILLLLFVFLYVAFRIGGYLVRVMLGNSGSNQSNPSSGSRPRDGNVKVNYDPDQKKKGYQGGEYVDYEEVD